MLASLHRDHVLAAVSPFWRHTTAPYGPLFLELVSLVVGITGQHLIGGVLLVRLLDLIGLALVAVYVPRIARSLGTDRGVAVWLAIACPLVTLSLIAAGHNDALMIGLLAAGVSVALRGNPLAGVAVCALAATIKVPALVGAVFITVAWARAEPDRSAQIRFVAACVAIVVVVLGVVTLASGVGLGWLSTSLFSTPAKVQARDHACDRRRLHGRQAARARSRSTSTHTASNPRSAPWRRCCRRRSGCGSCTAFASHGWWPCSARAC